MFRSGPVRSGPVFKIKGFLRIFGFLKKSWILIKIIKKWCQNHSKTIPKSSQNHPKIILKSSPNHPKTIPKSSQNHFIKSKNDPQNTQKVKNIFGKLDFWHFQPVSLVPTPPKSIKWVWKVICSLIFVKNWLVFAKIDFRNLVFGSKTKYIWSGPVRSGS